MKKLLSINKNSNTVDFGILIGRIGLAVLMLTHGLPKMEALFAGGEIKFPSVMGMAPDTALTLAVFAEVICSVFILVGFGTRFAVIPLIITMLVAAIVIHGADPLAKQEASLQYLVGYLVLLFTGSGKFSIDALLQKQETNKGRLATSKLAV